MRLLIATLALVLGAASVQAAPSCGSGSCGKSRVGLIQRVHDNRQARVQQRHGGATVAAPVKETSVSVGTSVIVGGCANGKCQLPTLKK